MPLGPAQTHAGPKIISPQGPEKHTGTSPTFFVAPGPKKMTVFCCVCWFTNPIDYSCIYHNPRSHVVNYISQLCYRKWGPTLYIQMYSISYPTIFR